MWTAELAPGIPRGPWIRSRTWDLLFIDASVLLVALPLAMYYGATLLSGIPPQSFTQSQALSIAMCVNLGCAFLIGGPHLYATYTLVLGESRFRRRHPRFLWGALVVPVVVVALAVTRVELLITVFFMWASVHAIHQLVYLVGQYHLRSGATPIPAWSRAIDYALTISCLYPIAFWRLLSPPGAVLDLPLGISVSQGFHIGAVDISRELPELVRGELWIAWGTLILFAAALAAFLARTAWEIGRGNVVWPRTLLLLCTVPAVFAIPLFDNLDVSLQGFNLWHSTQYIGLVYLMNSYRRSRGEISSPTVRWLSGSEHWHRYYGFLVAVSVGAGSLIGFFHYVVGLPLLQAYYGVHLSALWIHYLWDHLVFAERDALTMPVAAAAAG